MLYKLPIVILQRTTHKHTSMHCVLRQEEGARNRERLAVNTFVLELLHAHSVHGSTQSYFTSILHLANAYLAPAQCLLPVSYQQAARYWAHYACRYHERHVCPKCSYLYPRLKQDGRCYSDDKLTRCPECDFPRRDAHGEAFTAFRYWPLASLFSMLFMTPEKAALVRTWKQSLPAEDAVVEELKSVYGVPSL